MTDDKENLVEMSYKQLFEDQLKLIGNLREEVEKEREWKEEFMYLVEGESALNERWQQICLIRDDRISQLEYELNMSKHLYGKLAARFELACKESCERDLRRIKVEVKNKKLEKALISIRDYDAGEIFWNNDMRDMRDRAALALKEDGDVDGKETEDTNVQSGS